MRSLDKHTADMQISETLKSESPEQRALLDRVGWRAASTLIVTTLAMFAVVGFISFLWFAGVDNAIWHRIMAHEWATRSVTISTLILRFAIDIQAGVAAAMLAAILLESSSVRLHRVGQLSTMRATNPQPRALLEILPAMITVDWTRDKLESIGYGLIIVFLTATTTALQFSSTVLLSDLSLGQLPGLSSVRTMPYEFNYTSHAKFQKYGKGVGKMISGEIRYPLQPKISTWWRSPASFPAFGEFSEQVPSVEGVDDTGILLRAFVPFAEAQARETLRNYSGNAMLLDSRVSCQRPNLSNVAVKEVHSWETDTTITTFGRITGSLSPSKPNVERLWTPEHAVPFNCSLMLNAESFMLCQLTATNPKTSSYVDNGGLLPEFWNLTNVTAAIGEGLILWQLPLLVFQVQNISWPYIDPNISAIEDDGVWTNVVTSKQTWSLSVCYSSWMTADLDVDMYSDRNRTEPIALWDRERGYYTEPSVFSQFGCSKETESSPEDRGILHLKRRSSWIPNWERVVPNQAQPFVQQFADIVITENVVSLPCIDCSALLPPTFRGDSFARVGSPTLGPYYSNFIFALQRSPDIMLPVDNAISTIFHKSFETSGSLARAVSSLITVMSSMSYYDQMPAFDQEAKTTQISFVTVLFPQSHLGLWSLGITLAAHLVLVCCIAFGFAFRSRYTFLGNHWQTIAQIVGPETEGILSDSSMSSDKEVRNETRATGNENARVGIRALKNRRTVGLSVVEHEVVAHRHRSAISRPTA